MAMLVSGSLGVGAAYIMTLSARLQTAAAVLMILGIPTMMIGIMMLGARRRGSIGALRIPFAAVWLIVVCGFLTALFLPPDTVAMPHIFAGVPRRAAIILYGIGLLPLLGMPLAYAATFDDFTLSETELARLRADAQAIVDAEHTASRVAT
jgi:hypothetical protein